MVEPAPKAQAVLAAAYASLLITAAAQAAPDCLALKNQRDQLARQAMNAEIALMHSIRQRLCPRVEERAAQLNALEHETATPEPLNYENYIRCREKAEIQLQRGHFYIAIYGNLPFTPPRDHALQGLLMRPKSFSIAAARCKETKN